jgi:hypothetical protein
MLTTLTVLATLLVAPQAARQPGQFTCQPAAPTGEICLIQRDNGYDAGYTNAHVRSRVDFNLHTNEGTFGSAGDFWSVPGQINTYFFGVGYKRWAILCLYSRDFQFVPLCTDPLYT